MAGDEFCDDENIESSSSEDTLGYTEGLLF